MVEGPVWFNALVVSRNSAKGPNFGDGLWLKRVRLLGYDEDLDPCMSNIGYESTIARPECAADVSIGIAASLAVNQSGFL